MPRELRPRRTRQSYTNILHSEDEGEKGPGPSQQRDDNGSNFAPPVAREEAARSDKDGGSDDGIGDPSSIGNNLGTGIDPGSEMNTPHSKKKSGGGASQGRAAKTKSTKAKGKQKASSQVVAPSPAPTPATPQSTITNLTALPPTPTPTPQIAPFYATAASARQNYALPNPNIHHRHRPVPLFEGPTASATALKAASASASTTTATATVRVERLQRPPRLFAPNETVPTNAYASAALITRRVGKAWSASVGAGPVWQVVEDLGWFRESEGFLDRGAAQESGQGLASARQGQGQGQGIVCDERARRPRVHDDVALREGWTVFPHVEDAVAYMPTDLGGGGSVSGPDVPAAPAAAAAPPVSCDFGPFGEQMRVDLKTLDTQRLSQFLPESRSHVFNAGASVWGLDWCPIHPDDRPHCSYKHYLAVAPMPSRTHSPEIGIKVPRPSRACVQLWSLGPSEGAETSDDDKGEMRCEMVMCIDSGPALELKWCPLPSHDSLSDRSPPSPRKLGLLAGVFEDGSLSVYAVPYPQDLTSAQPSSTTSPIYVRLPEPIVRIELEEAAFCTLDWGNSELIAAGMSNGIIVVYNLRRALRSTSEPTVLPVGYYCVHQSAVRALAWVRVPDRHGNGPTVISSGGYDGLQCLTDIRDLGGHVFNRTRDAINSFAYSPYLSAVVTIDHENTIKSYSLSPSTLGRGHALVDPGGPVWSISASDYHPQLAVGSADGTCYTTNGLRATRRGGYVPFLVHRVYQLDYSRKEGRFRMLDLLKPREMAERPEGGGGAWHTSVGVQRVVWHSGAGLAAAPLLASATGSGLCRVDFLEGRWFRDRTPYERVEAMRLEEDVMDVDADEIEDNDDFN